LTITSSDEEQWIKSEGRLIMSFLKKFTETVIDTATSVGNKSADLMETGKLKMQRSKIEGAIKEQKAGIGEIVYQAYKHGGPTEESALSSLFAEISTLENQMKDIDEKVQEIGETKEAIPPTAGQQDPHETYPEGRTFCADCGQELSPGAKFCKNCGKSV